MIKLATGVLITVLVLGLATVALLRYGTTGASSLEEPDAVPAQAQPAAQTQPVQVGEQPHPQVVPGDEDEDGDAFLGLVVHALARIHRRTPMDGVRKAEGGVRELQGK